MKRTLSMALAALLILLALTALRKKWNKKEGAEL